MTPSSGNHSRLISADRRRSSASRHLLKARFAASPPFGGDPVSNVNGSELLFVGGHDVRFVRGGVLLEEIDVVLGRGEIGGSRGELPPRNQRRFAGAVLRAIQFEMLSSRATCAGALHASC